MNVDIGAKIKVIRKQKKISIQALAEKSGLSTGLISQIERNQTTPSIVSLWKLTQALEVSIGSLFNEAPPVPPGTAQPVAPIIRRDDRKRLLTHKQHAVYEALSPEGSLIQFLMITLEPTTYSSEGLVVHEGEECGLVLEGQLIVVTDQGDHFLNQGDSITFPSTIPHRYINPGNVPSVSVWAMTPAKF